jgi:hypothetical protein
MKIKSGGLMKKIYFVLFFFMLLSPSAFPWTDTTGSTTTTAGSPDYDLKDIGNAEFDSVRNAMRVVDISTEAVVSLQNIYNALFALSRSSGTDLTIQRLEQIIQKTKDVVVSSGNINIVNSIPLNVWVTSGVITKVERLDSFGEGNVWVTSGMITIANPNDFKNIWITSGIITTLENISQLSELRNVWITSGSITILNPNDFLNTWITSGSINITNVNDFKNVWITSGGVISAVLESTVCVKGGSLDEVKIVNSVLESSGVIKNFPTDYPDSNTTSAVGNVETAIKQVSKDVVITSGVVSDSRYANKNSTGTGGMIMSLSINDPSFITLTYAMTEFSAYSVGGSTPISITSTFTDGIFYIVDGIPFTKTVPNPINNPVIKLELPQDCTIYYSITGVK